MPASPVDFSNSKQQFDDSLRTGWIPEFLYIPTYIHLSALQQLANASAVQTFIAGLMLAALPSTPTAVAILGATPGTFTSAAVPI
jgi:hypothetical protein